MRLKTRLTSMAQERGPQSRPTHSERDRARHAKEREAAGTSSRSDAQAGRNDSVPFAPFPRDRLRAGRHVYVGDGRPRARSDPMRVVIFYVSDPDTPFLDVERH